MVNKKKLFRLTTVDLSLDKLITGQLKFLSDYYNVTGVAADTGLLQGVAEREGVKVIDVPMHREMALGADLKSLWTLYKLFRKEKPYILHCNTPKGSLLGLMAGKLAGVQNRVYTVTGLRYQGASGLFRFILMTMERISCFCATKVIPEGQGVLHCLQEDHITSKPLKVLHYGNINGIDTSYWKRDDEVKGERLEVKEVRPFTFVFVGRIVKDKGSHELAYAMKQLESVKLIMVGSFEDGDPVAPEDKEFFETSDKVECVGWQDNVKPYLQMADALVFPSYREGFPNAPMQAGAMNLPCIVTNINGCNEIITSYDNENYNQIGKLDIRDNGIVIPSRDGEALYNAMKWMVEHPVDARRMGSNARKMIKDRYEQQDVWNALLKMYQSLN